MKYSIHGFTWQLDGNHIDMARAIPDEPAHVKVASIILATGVLPTAVPPQQEVDDLGAWIKARRWMRTRQIPVFTDAEKRSIWAAKEGKSMLAIMARFLDDGIDPPRGSDTDRLLSMRWVDRDVDKWKVVMGYYTHIGAMVRAMIIKEGPCGGEYLSERLMEDRDFMRSVMGWMGGRGEVWYDMSEGMWHLT